MDTNIIIVLLIGYLVVISLVRRQMLNVEIKKPERRSTKRRHDKRRAHSGRRVHEFNTDCEVKNRREREDRREGLKDRRNNERRHHPQLAAG